MKGKLAQTTLEGDKALSKIVKTGIIGTNSEPKGFQPPIFKEKPLVFCSYICEGYEKTYGDRKGIIFETDFPVIYACPVDTFHLLRGGNWLPGYEKFIFSSIENMLRKYPNSEDFKKDFRIYFKNLNPEEIYPEEDITFAKINYERDYCLGNRWVPGCNEVTFSKPLKIKNYKIFNSREELANFLI
jgi:hypothetical protein